MEDTMATADQTGPGKPNKDSSDARSDNLLPAEDGKDDGRFEVAEEVSLDQQSDTARQVGHGPQPTSNEPTPPQRRAP
jgi:hypothetical protein